MKLLVLVAVIVAIGYVNARPDGQYTTKYDNVDLEQILMSDRLLTNYVNCLLDKGTCTPDGAELKRVLPDALETDCAKCTEKQRNGSRQVLRHLLKHKRDWWNELETKYDPQKKYVSKYADELKAKGIEI